MLWCTQGSHTVLDQSTEARHTTDSSRCGIHMKSKPLPSPLTYIYIYMYVMHIYTHTHVSCQPAILTVAEQANARYGKCTLFWWSSLPGNSSQCGDTSGPRTLPSPISRYQQHVYIYVIPYHILTVAYGRTWTASDFLIIYIHDTRYVYSKASGAGVQYLLPPLLLL